MIVTHLGQDTHQTKDRGDEPFLPLVDTPRTTQPPPRRLSELSAGPSPRFYTITCRSCSQWDRSRAVECHAPPPYATRRRSHFFGQQCLAREPPRRRGMPLLASSFSF